MTELEKLEHFEELCYADAAADADREVDAFREELRAAFEAHKEKKEKEAAAVLVSEQAAVDRELKRQFSEKQLDIRANLAGRQDLVRRRLFKRVEEKLLDAKASPAYTDFLVRKIEEAKTFAGNDVLTVYIDPSDAQLLNTIEEKTGIRPEISREDFTGGVRTVIRSRHILIDNSLKALMHFERTHYSFDLDAEDGV